MSPLSLILFILPITFSNLLSYSFSSWIIFHSLPNERFLKTSFILSLFFSNSKKLSLFHFSATLFFKFYKYLYNENTEVQITAFLIQLTKVLLTSTYRYSFIIT